MSNAIRIDDDFKGWDANAFVMNNSYRSHIDTVLIPRGMVIDRIQAVANSILNSYINDDKLFKSSSITNGHSKSIRIQLVCILKGASIFFHSLFEQLCKIKKFLNVQIEFTIHYLRTRSYKDTCSTGKVHTTMDNLFDELNADQPILLVEDVIDTGRTLHCVLDSFRKFSSNVKVVVLCKKRIVNRPLDSKDIDPDFCCFNIPDKYVIGFGFDVNDRFRDLEHVCIFKNEN